MLFDSKEPLNVINEQLSIDIAGLDKEKLTAFCLTLTYKLKNPANVLPVGESSIGKSNLMLGVLKFFPVAHRQDVITHNVLLKKCLNENNMVKFNQTEKDFWNKFDGLLLDGMSGQAIKRYLANEEWFSWDNKILAIGELDSAIMAQPLLRTLSSEGGGVSMVTEKSATGRFHTLLYSTDGRPMLFATTASDAVEHQFANRCVMIEIGQNNGYLHKVHEKIGLKYSHEVVESDYKQIRKELKRMKPIDGVIIPYAPLISKYWYKTHPASNRTLQDFFRLIHGVTVLHHRQRKKRNGYLLSTPQDYELARQIFCGMKLKLTAPLLKTLHALEELEKDTCEREVQTKLVISAYTLDEIADYSFKSPRRVYDDLMELMNQGLISRVKWTGYDGSPNKPFIYHLSEFAKSDLKIESWEKLTGEKIDCYSVNIGD